MWDRVAAVLVRRRILVLAIAAAVTVTLGSGLSRLAFSTSQDTLVSPSSQVYKDNTRYQSQFGGQTMLVLLSGDPVGLFSAPNIDQLQRLESELRATAGVATVVGPYTSLRYAADELSVAPGLLGQALARAGDPAALSARIQTETQRLTAAGEQSLANPAFVRFLLFEPGGSVRPALQSSFPDANHALFVVRITGNASIEEQGRVATAVEAIVARHAFSGYRLVAAGSPVLLREINDYLQGGMASLGLIAIVVMIVVLGVAFRVRLRLLPLVIVAAGTAAALGAALWAGVPLTLVTISGLPIFIGLGVDFAVQVQNRYVEQREGGDAPEVAARVAVSRMAPPLTVAMIAGVGGFVALRLSKVPMIRDFGLLLSLGVLILVTAALALPAAVLVLADRGQRSARSGRNGRSGVLERALGRVVTPSRPIIASILVLGVAVAGAGFAVEGRLPIQTDPERWVSQQGTAVRELKKLRAETGFSDELGIMVQAPDVTSDAVVAWIYRFQTAELQRHPGQLLQAASMPGIAAGVVGITPSGGDVRALLALAPRDIAASLVSADRRVTNVVFPVGPISLAERGRLVASIQRDLAGDLAPPPNVTATPSGLAVIGVELVKGLEANRQTLTLAALGLVFLWLLVRGRGRPRSVLPVVPVAIAVGISTFVVWALGFSLTPLTTVAAPLVIAVATEFSVLLEARYGEERRAGRSPIDAVKQGLPRIGRAFVASGLTLIGGFGVLAASPMPLLRDFGVVVAIDVAVALASTLVVMPSLLRWTDREGRPGADGRGASSAGARPDPGRPLAAASAAGRAGDGSR